MTIFRSEQHHPDYHSYGFKLDEIAALLREKGIYLEGAGSSGNDGEPMPETWPEWKVIMAEQYHLSLREAAGVFAGVDVQGQGWPSDEQEVEIGRWLRVLTTAIECGELACVQVESGDGVIQRGDLMAWCRARRRPWPLPWVDDADLPTSDVGLLRELIEARAEIGRLTERVARSDGQAKELRSLQSKCGDLENELRNAIEIAAARGTISADDIDSRSEKTYLHIVAVLLGYIEGNHPGAERHPSYGSDAKMIGSIVSVYAGFFGLGERNLTKKFAAARKSEAYKK